MISCWYSATYDSGEAKEMSPALTRRNSSSSNKPIISMSFWFYNIFYFAPSTFFLYLPCLRSRKKVVAACSTSLLCA